MAAEAESRSTAPAGRAGGEGPQGVDPAVSRRLLRHGVDGIGNAELLGVLLGVSGACAARLLAELDGLSTLLAAPAPRLMRMPGMGPARVARLLAAAALVERGALEGLVGAPVLSCTSSVRRFLRNRFGGISREEFGALFLDTRHRLIRFEVLFLGTVDRAQVHPRELLRRALELNAAALILAHNHPSGVAEPSASDIRLTRELSDLLGRVDVRILDHLVVGRGSEVSLAERGLL